VKKIHQNHLFDNRAEKSVKVHLGGNKESYYIFLGSAIVNNAEKKHCQF
jgi:hypothetical protein